MARSGTVNQTPATGSEAMYIHKERLKVALWTITKSSDGTTYNSSGDQITTGASGAGGMANSLAWYVAQDPGGRRQLCFQRASANNTQWRIKFSESAGFTGGTPGATRVPSATDEGVVLGSGTDASPTMATKFNTDGTYKFHSVAESAVVTGSNVYMHWFGTTRTGTGECDALFMCDGLRAGTYGAVDTSPCVIWCSYDATKGIDYAWFGEVTPVAANGLYAWFKHGLSGATFQAMTSDSFGADNAGYPCYTATNQVGAWAEDSFDGAKEIFFARLTGNSAPIGPKGTAAHMKHAFSARSYPSTYGYNTADPYLFFGKLSAGGGCSVLLPWIVGTAPVL